ncbi:transposase [Salinisphaera orenii]|uniref:transposase n=1 Tax=Salinisphaera orenii TaxID=856731 RepID=UPI000F4CF7FD|nr:transposase [Salinisphaera orenii]
MLTSIPGISAKTAALLLPELGDPLSFTGAREIAAFAGLNPKLAELGEHKGSAHISRTGSVRRRVGLYVPAIVTMTHNPAIKALRQRLQQRGKAGKQIACAVCVNCCILCTACSNPTGRSIRHSLLHANTRDCIY